MRARAWLSIVGALAFAGVALAEDDPGYKTYLQYCASCHGFTAEGNGPVAPLLRKPPADLRMLSSRYGSPLPKQRLLEVIDGRQMPRSHGTSEMPVWGDKLTESVPASPLNEARKRGTIQVILQYLESIQIEAPEPGD